MREKKCYKMWEECNHHDTFLASSQSCNSVMTLSIEAGLSKRKKKMLLPPIGIGSRTDLTPIKGPLDSVRSLAHYRPRSATCGVSSRVASGPWPILNFASPIYTYKKLFIWQITYIQIWGLIVGFLMFEIIRYLITILLGVFDGF